MVQLWTTTAYKNVKVLFVYLIYGCILLNIDLSSETNNIHCHCLILLMYCLLLNAQWQIFNEYSGRSHIQQMNDY